MKTIEQIPGMDPELKAKLQENDASTAAQKRFIAGQEEEKKRINQRFDDELAKLQVLWAGPAAPPAAMPVSDTGSKSATKTTANATGNVKKY